MRKIERIGITVLAVLLLAGLFACGRSGKSSQDAGEETAFDFSETADGVPSGWTVNSYEGGYRTFGENGEVGFESFGADDLRFVRTVAVEPETCYVLSAEMSTEDVKEGQGATLSIDNYAIDGSFIYSEPLFGTNDWTPALLAFRTAKEQESVTLALRLGGYSAESSGSVRFRNVRLKQTDNAAIPFQNLSPVTQSADASERTEEDYENVFTTIFWIGAIAAIVLLFGLYGKGKQLMLSDEPANRKYEIFAALVMIGLVVRFVLCAVLKGHSTDMSCWQGWGCRVAEEGTHTFYVDNWCDYPPGYMLVCGLLYRIASIFPEGPFRLFVYMVPAFLCDVLSGFLMLNRAKRFALGDKAALFLSGLIVLNPAAVFLSGAWGQIDSVLTVLLIGTFLLLNMSCEKPYYRVLAGLLYGVAILMKWQALIFGPVLALMYIMTGVDQWGTKRFTAHVLWSVAAVIGAVGVLLLGSILFRGEGMDLLWMIERFRSASSGYDYASIEAYNYMTLFGGNWAKATNPLFGSANAGEMLLRINELFSKTALLIGFPTLVLRAWNEMRRRQPDQPNRAFYELLTTSIITALLFLNGYLIKQIPPLNSGSGLFLRVIDIFRRVITAFPLYGIMMLAVFFRIVFRESSGKPFLDWIKEGSTTVVGAMTLSAALCAFVLTYIFGVILKLFGGALTWHVSGVLGIVGAGVLTVFLFVLYWNTHRKTRYSICVNRGLIFLLAACFCVWVFTFGHYMHERYIFPALVLLLFAYAYDRDPHTLAAFCMLTVTTFMNEMMAMFVVSDGAKDLIRGGVIHNQLIAVISLMEFCAAMYLTAICFRKALVFDPSDPTGEWTTLPQKPLRATNGKRR